MIAKTVHIILALFMLISSVGFTVSRHYCHEQLVEVAIDSTIEPCCTNGDCCKTETTLVKFDDDAITKAQLEVPATTFSFVDFSTYIVLDENVTPVVIVKKFIEYKSPPPLPLNTFLACVQTYLL